MKSLAHIETLIRRFQRNGYLPLLVLTVAIQGTVLISQTLASLFVPLDHTGAIRTFESVASVAILCGSLGTQTLAIREIAAARASDRQARILGELLFLPFIGAGALGLLALVLMMTGRTLGGVGATSLLPAIALILLVSLTRLLSGAAQGLFKVDAVYRWVIVGSGAAVLCHLAGAFWGSLTSWIIGRCLGEAILLASVAHALWNACPALWTMGRASLRGIALWVRTGISVNIALILRMTADALPIVMMGAISARAVIGQFGIATLALTLALLPIAVSTQLALPKLAAVPLAEQRQAFRRLVFGVLAGAVLLSGGATGLGLAVRPWLGSAERDSVTAILVILWTLPLRSLALGFGALSLARSNYLGPLLVNLVELVTVATVMALKPFGGTIWTPLLAVFIGASVSFAGMALQTVLIGSWRRRPGVVPDDIVMVD